MSQVLQPWQLLVALLAGWINEHQLHNRLIDAPNDKVSAAGAVECSQRLGGMLRFYHRVAA